VNCLDFMVRRVQLTWNDFFLIAALTYSIIVLALKWDRYVNCHKPIQLFLLVNYITILIVRFTQLLEQAYDDNALYLKILAYVKFGFLYTFFVAWTIVGTVWFQDSGKCLPEHNQYWTCLIWIIMCYTWIVVYLCLRGAMLYSEHRSLGIASRFLSTGLSAREINEIVSYPAPPELEEKECSICIETYRIGVRVKSLPRCTHIFHANCIDQWLKRKTTCPLCRLQVKDTGENPQENHGGTNEQLISNSRRTSQSDFDIPLQSGDKDYEIPIHSPLVINSDQPSDQPSSSQIHSGNHV